MYFLNINKPINITSFDVIKFLRKKLKVKQIGHSGTLDPLATGVIQVAVGKATKLLDYLESNKTYYTEMKFGYVTETYDAEKEEIFISKPNFNKEDLDKILQSFVGKTKQIPPKYSAIKINGNKVCTLARKNPDKEIKIEPREIEIYSIKLINFDNEKYTASIEVSCKKGTYIRSLVNDIGKELKCGAYVTKLTRIKAGSFEIKDANALDDEILNEINPLDALNIEKYELNEDEFKKIQNGNFIQNNIKTKNNLILLTKNNKLISVAVVEKDKIKPKKYFGE